MSKSIEFSISETTPQMSLHSPAPVAYQSVIITSPKRDQVYHSITHSSFYNSFKQIQTYLLV